LTLLSLTLVASKLNLDSMYLNTSKVEFILLSILFLIFSDISSQCPNGSAGLIEINSQEKINELFLDYPNCTILNELTIELNNSSTGTPVNDLEPLSQLRTLEGFLKITRNRNNSTSIDLKSVKGLKNLEEVDGLIIEYADEIVDLGFTDLLVKDILELVDLPKLSSIEGLRIEDEMGNLNLGRCPQLDVGSSFDNLRKVSSWLELNHPDRQWTCTRPERI